MHRQIRHYKMGRRLGWHSQVRKRNRLTADVDLQAGVRRVRPLHCPPQVLLSTMLQVLHC